MVCFFFQCELRLYETPPFSSVRGGAFECMFPLWNSLHGMMAGLYITLNNPVADQLTNFIAHPSTNTHTHTRIISQPYIVQFNQNHQCCAKRSGKIWGGSPRVPASSLKMNDPWIEVLRMQIRLRAVKQQQMPWLKKLWSWSTPCTSPWWKPSQWLQSR